MTVYSDFIKQWSKDNGLSYMCSIGDPRLKADYLKFKAGEYEFEITPAPKKKSRKREANERFSMMSEDFNVNDFERANQSFENQQMGSQDRNIAMPRSKINAAQLINKLKQIKELASMGKQDKNVGLNISNLINQIEEAIDFTPAPKKKSVPKTTKENMKKIKDAMVALVEKYAGKLKDLEIKKSDMSLSVFKEQKQNLLEKLDNVIENILNKQETSSEELSDILEMYIDELTLIYKKVDGLKDPIKKKVEGSKAKPKEESVEEKTKKLIAEKVVLNEELKKANLEKDKFLKKMNAIEEPSNEIKNQYMKLIFNYQEINNNIGKIQEKIYKLNGKYV
mgnify:CR=1 FL=1|tara:strand:- start:198 stop:1208 length:1011 start_codon:yes stop_codon:yes gene_type:complete